MPKKDEPLPVPTFFFVGFDITIPGEVREVTTRLIDISRWAAQNPAHRRFFPVTLPANTPVYGATPDPASPAEIRNNEFGTLMSRAWR